MSLIRKIKISDTGFKIDEIRRLYSSGKTLSQVSDIVGVSPSLISKWLKQYGCKLRPPRSNYVVDEDYFSTIDTEAKAYWLAFIWCDGYVGQRQREGRQPEFNFELSLNIHDIEHLEKLNKDLNSNYPIKEYSAASSKSKNEKKASLRIFNKRFSENLVNTYGFVAWRTEITKIIEKVPSSLMKHFIRGLIDSNGSIYSYYDVFKETERIGISLSSRSLDLLDFVQSHLMESCQIKTRRKTHKKLGNDGEVSMHYIGFNGFVQVHKILEYVYSDASVYLDRKYDKYKEAIEVFERRHIYFKPKMEVKEPSSSF